MGIESTQAYGMAARLLPLLAAQPMSHGARPTGMAGSLAGGVPGGFTGGVSGALSDALSGGFAGGLPAGASGRFAESVALAMTEAMQAATRTAGQSARQSAGQMAVQAGHPSHRRRARTSAPGSVQVSAPTSSAPRPASLPQSLSAAAAAVVPALQAAASRVGVDFQALLDTARVESGFNPNARARTSSATGLFQFVDSTWLATIARHGPRHGINPASRTEALALRRNPEVASLMAAEHMADNAAALSARLGRAVDNTELYLAHFLGVGGATRFLGAMATNPMATAATILPAAARANKAIFTDPATGRARSLGDVFAVVRSRLGAAGATGATAIAASHQRTGRAAASVSGAVPSASASAAPSPGQVRRAAQMAYLLLADLGAG